MVAEDGSELCRKEEVHLFMDQGDPGISAYIRKERTEKRTIVIYGKIGSEKHAPGVHIRGLRLRRYDSSARSSDATDFLTRAPGDPLRERPEQAWMRNSPVGRRRELTLASPSTL
jgi:hypothetical protein